MRNFSIILISLGILTVPLFPTAQANLYQKEHLRRGNDLIDEHQHETRKTLSNAPFQSTRNLKKKRKKKKNIECDDGKLLFTFDYEMDYMATKHGVVEIFKNGNSQFSNTDWTVNEKNFQYACLKSGKCYTMRVDVPVGRGYYKAKYDGDTIHEDVANKIKFADNYEEEYEFGDCS